MLDLFGIVFSSTIMFLVILRAVQADMQTPWFSPPKTGSDSSGLKLQPNTPPSAGTGYQPNRRAGTRHG